MFRGVRIMNISEMKRSKVLLEPLETLSKEVAHIIWLLAKYNFKDSELFTLLEKVEQEIENLDVKLPLVYSQESVTVPTTEFISESIFTDYRRVVRKKQSVQ